MNELTKSIEMTTNQQCELRSKRPGKQNPVMLEQDGSARRTDGGREKQGEDVNAKKRHHHKPVAPAVDDGSPILTVHCVSVRPTDQDFGGIDRSNKNRRQ